MRTKEDVKRELVQALKRRFLDAMKLAREDVVDYASARAGVQEPAWKDIMRMINELDRVSRNLADLWLGTEESVESCDAVKRPVNSSRRTVKKYVARRGTKR